MENNTTGNRLHNLKGSDYEIVDGEPDIRGWSVRLNSDSHHIGKVEDLIFDPQARKVRYMVVKVDKEDFEGQSSSHRDVLVPIGLAELRNVDNDVFLQGISLEQLAALPPYEGTVTPDIENKIRAILAGAGAVTLSGGTGEDFYSHEHYDDRNLYAGTKDADTTVPIIEESLNVGKQTVETGGAYIRSRIVEKPVEETIRLQEERVQVQRRPVDKLIADQDFDRFEESVVELKEYAEVPVVSKEARVVEEVTIGKEVTERSETVRDTVRKTEVDVENVPGSSHSSISSDEIRKDN